MGLLDSFKPGDSGPKVAFVGLDGVPRSFVQEMIDAGRFPNIAEIADGGSLVGMDAVVPAESSACWPAMTTGTNPGKTGVLGFQDRERDSYETYIPLGRHVQSRRVWRHVEDTGRSSIVMNVPVTYPPEEIDGVMVSGFLTPDVDQVSSDPEVVDYLESIDYRVDVDAGLGHEDKEALVEDAHATLEARKEALLHFVEQEEWSLVWHVFMATDRLNHFLWEDYEEGDELAEPFLDFYERVDEVVGEIRDALPDDATMLVAADHGFCTLDREVDMNTWLRQEGYQTLEAGGDSLADVTADTEVYSLIPGRFYVNLEDREPDGAVSEDRYGEVLDALEADLEALEDPDGRAVVDRVVRRDDVYHGDAVGMTPDLVALPNRGFDLKAGFDPDKELFRKGARNGMHTFDDAMLAVDGHDVPDDGVDIMDVAPTVLDLLELDVPDAMDGESLVR